MNDVIERFGRNRKSHIDISIFLIIVMLMVLSYLSAFVFEPILGRLVLGNYIISIISFGLAGLLLRGYLGVPNGVVVTVSGIQCGNKKINWDTIKSVTFTCSGGRDYRDTWIVLDSGQESNIIHAKYYEEPRKLRNLVEKLCNEKGIKYVVEDRGLW